MDIQQGKQGKEADRNILEGGADQPGLKLGHDHRVHGAGRGRGAAGLRHVACSVRQRRMTQCSTEQENKRIYHILK